MTSLSLGRNRHMARTSIDIGQARARATSTEGGHDAQQNSYDRCCGHARLYAFDSAAKQERRRNGCDAHDADEHTQGSEHAYSAESFARHNGEDPRSDEPCWVGHQDRDEVRQRLDSDDGEHRRKQDAHVVPQQDGAIAYEDTVAGPQAEGCESEPRSSREVRKVERGSGLHTR